MNLLSIDPREELLPGAGRAPTAKSSLPRLVGLGVAVPARQWRQEQVRDCCAGLWNLRGEELDRWHRIIAGSAIYTRHGVLGPDEVMHLTTAQRMAAYETYAPPLALQAAQAALRDALVAPERVTDLIVVTCTGFAAPGVDVELVERLGLRRDVRRTIVGFMGCFGAIIGLRTAVGACSADPKGVALVVCVELCSLHMRADRNPQNQVATALFADGAAAAVVAGRQAGAVSEAGEADGGYGSLGIGASLLLAEGRSWMSWRITDAGFAMTLTRDVPVALRQRIASFVADASSPRPQAFAVHPGGAAILDAVDAALCLHGEHGVAESRAVLAQCGNMSSATILFVLRKIVSSLGTSTPFATATPRLPVLLLAFGPGLTIESLPLLSNAADAR
jgi:predicted naringenin-chalcone synthase